MKFSDIAATQQVYYFGGNTIGRGYYTGLQKVEVIETLEDDKGIYLMEIEFKDSSRKTLVGQEIENNIVLDIRAALDKQDWKDNVEDFGRMLGVLFLVGILFVGFWATS